MSQVRTCGTDAAFWLDLQGGRLPEEGQETTARACGSYGGNCCAHVRNVFVRRCSSFFIYKLTATPNCNGAYCAQLQYP